MYKKIAYQKPNIDSQLVLKPAPLNNLSAIHVKPRYKEEYFFPTVR